ELAGDDLAISVDEERCWQYVYAAVLISDGFLADKDRIIDAHFLHKLGDVFLAGVVHGNADNLQPLGSVLLLQFDKPGHLDLAGTAPGRPEVQQDRLSFVAAELNVLALEGFESEIGGGFAGDFEAVIVAVAGPTDAVRCDIEHGRHQDSHEKQS